MRIYLYMGMLTMAAQLCMAAHPGQAGTNSYCNTEDDGRKRRGPRCTAEASDQCIDQYCQDQVRNCKYQLSAFHCTTY